MQNLELSAFRARRSGGVLITNPPYGLRIGEEKTVKKLYADLRGVFENMEYWELFVLCGNENFQKYFGRRADKNRKLYNGNILTYLYMYLNK